MEDITTNKQTVIKDSAGRIVLVVARSLAAVSIGETIPEGTLGWDSDDGTINQYSGGSWTPTLGDTIIDGTLTVSGLSSSGQATFNGSVEVHGTEDAGGIKFFAGQGDESTEAHRHEGTVTVDLDLAGVDHKDSVATLVPARAWVHAVSAQVLTTFTGGTVAKFDIGFTGGDASGLINDDTLITLGNFQVAAVAIGLTSNDAASGITVTALTAGDAPAVCTTGKVRVTLWYSRVDGPTGVTYA